MIDKLLQLVAPHHCCGCNKIGILLCDDCKYNITNDADILCLACGLAVGATGVHTSCQVPYSRAWCAGERSGVLQRLIGNYKFQNVKSAYVPLARLLNDIIPQLPPETVIVPVPTVASHIRQRGYDHTLLFAKELALRRGYHLQQTLVRRTATTQRGAGRSLRITQAKEAFAVNGDIAVDTSVPHVIVDDIITTGATITSAADQLRLAGVTQVWVAVIARQPLD